MNNWVLKLFTILLLATGPMAWADTVQDGNAAFAKGDFPAAVRAYETALAAGPKSAGLYYNLATAQLKAGERPQAALNLRRALMLDPGFADARVSLSEIERSQGVPVVKDDWQTQVAAKAPLSAILIVGAVLFWIGAFLILAALLRQKKFVPVLAGVILLIFGTVVALVGALADPKLSERDSGVIVAGSDVPLLSAPADQSATLTKLAPAASVQVIRESGEWTYCQAPGGEKGWLPSSSIQRVVPAT